MTDPATRARTRFAALRDDALAALDDGRLDTVLATPPPPPPGWCVAALARTDAGDGAVGSLAGVLGPDVWWYPGRSRHISLVALTAREPEPIPPRRADALADAVADLLGAGEPFGFEVDGLGVLGTQLFAEIVPGGSGWAELRLAVAAVAEELGERPLRHPDPEPIHLNLARFVGPGVDRGVLRALLTAPRSPRPFVVAELEIVVTDFVVGDAATTLVRRSSRTAR